MYYVDTNLLVSYVLASDAGHETSVRELERLAAGGQTIYASSFTLTEMYNVLCRRLSRGEELAEPLRSLIVAYSNRGSSCKFLMSAIMSLLVKKLSVKFVDYERLYELEPVALTSPPLKVPKVLRKAMDLSERIQIRTKDLLHLAYASELAKIYNIKYFLTSDVEDFKKVKDRVERELQLKIILVA